MMITWLVLSLMWMGVNGCREPVDLLFLVDGSSEVSSSNFMQQKSFVSSQPMEYLVSPDGVRIGAMVYSDIGSNKLEFKISENELDFVSHISRIVQPGGKRVIRNALQSAHELILKDARPGSRRVVVLITSGRSRTLWESFRLARAMRKDNILVYAIGVGNKISHSELMGITGERYNVLTVDTFQDLFSLSAKLHELICPASNLVHQSIPQDSSLFKAEVELTIIANSDNKGESPLLPQRIHLIDNYSVAAYKTTPASTTEPATVTTTEPATTTKPSTTMEPSTTMVPSTSIKHAETLTSINRNRNHHLVSEPLTSQLIYSNKPKPVSNRIVIDSDSVNRQKKSNSLPTSGKLTKIPFGFVDESITDLKQISSLIKRHELSMQKKSSMANTKSELEKRKNNSNRFESLSLEAKIRKDTKSIPNVLRNSKSNNLSSLSMQDSAKKEKIVSKIRDVPLRSPAPIAYDINPTFKPENNAISQIRPSPISIPAFGQSLILINEKSIWDTLIGNIQPIIKYQTPSLQSGISTTSLSSGDMVKIEEIQTPDQKLPFVSETSNKFGDVIEKTESTSKDILFKANSLSIKNKKLTEKVNSMDMKDNTVNSGVLFQAKTAALVSFPDMKKSFGKTPKSSILNYSFNNDRQKAVLQDHRSETRRPSSVVQSLHSDKQIERMFPSQLLTSLSTSINQIVTTFPPPTSDKRRYPQLLTGSISGINTHLVHKPNLGERMPINTERANDKSSQRKDIKKQRRKPKPTKKPEQLLNTQSLSQKEHPGNSKPTQVSGDHSLSRKGRPVNIGPSAFPKDLKQEVAMLLEILMLEHDRMMTGKKKKRKQTKNKSKKEKETEIVTTTPATIWKTIKQEKKEKQTELRQSGQKNADNKLKHGDLVQNTDWNFRRPTHFLPGTEVNRKYLSKETESLQEDDAKTDSQLLLAENDNCHLKPYNNDAGFYMEQMENRTVVRPCPGGTAFDIHSCACTIMTVTRIISECEPEILLDFNNNVKDNSGKNIHVGADHIEIHNGSARFLDNADITIWRFTGSHIGRKLLIKARFKATQDSESTQYIISNCNYGNDASYSIEINNVDKVVVFTLDTEPRQKKEIKIPFELNQWTSVSLIYDGLRFTGEVNGNKKSVPLAGDVETRSSPLRIGGCGVKKNRFSGLIDEVSMSFCIPKRRRG